MSTQLALADFMENSESLRIFRDEFKRTVLKRRVTPTVDAITSSWLEVLDRLEEKADGREELGEWQNLCESELKAVVWEFWNRPWDSVNPMLAAWHVAGIHAKRGWHICGLDVRHEW